jgi:hypothetical protein
MAFWSHIISLYIHYLNIIASYTSAELLNKMFIVFYTILFTLTNVIIITFFV